ncbi:hypothetical protein I6N98_02510 [Spongiibacter nanhainus]|uniref:SpoIIAA-like protein n=1 Tax=Spongiibacter nanhainus TaxID=2794344 RepID=A0A7T4R1L2_9GAMM|nr:hypothetical protein [Spongiibacter nanhainus]QQD18760.1 hypothetical protein I6N98_02510 [Spongiibacter nanhainus]
MPHTHLSFATLTQLHPRIVCMTVNEGIELDVDQCREYEDWRCDNVRQSYGLLLDKSSSFSWSYEAQQWLVRAPSLAVMAVLSYTRMSDLSFEVLKSIPGRGDRPMALFHNRANAMHWLYQQLECADQSRFFREASQIILPSA